MLEAQDDGLQDLVRILAKVAGGDYSEKPEIVEDDTPLARFTLAVRFMIDDLESSRADEERRHAALEEANAQLREVAAVKTRFINSAAQELNTPLTPIRVQMHLLRGGKLGPLAPDQAHALDLLSRNLDRLSLLVGDLLDAARVQSDELRIQPREWGLGELAEECRLSFAGQASEAGVRLETRVAPDHKVVADGRRLMQVLFNLVGNALKFTPRGGRILVEAERVEGATVVRVSDTGAGLAPDQRDRLFQAFSQVHDPMERTRSGTGLGLYICKGIVERHGGRIWVESDGPGKGSSFVFTLPLLDQGLDVLEARVPARPHQLEERHLDG